jgi:hypothetical protein
MKNNQNSIKEANNQAYSKWLDSKVLAKNNGYDRYDDGYEEYFKDGKTERPPHNEMINNLIKLRNSEDFSLSLNEKLDYELYRKIIKKMEEASKWVVQSSNYFVKSKGIDDEGNWKYDIYSDAELANIHKDSLCPFTPCFDSYKTQLYAFFLFPKLQSLRVGLTYFPNIEKNKINCYLESVIENMTFKHSQSKLTFGEITQKSQNDLFSQELVISNLKPQDLLVISEALIKIPGLNSIQD